VNEQPYLIDELSCKALDTSNDSRMTITSADTASKPAARSSLSLLRNNDNEMTTTSANSASKPARSSLSLLRHNDNEMTTTSADTASKPAAWSSLSLLRHNDNEMTTLSADARTKPAEPPVLHSHDDENKLTTVSSDAAAKSDKTVSSTPCRKNAAVTTVSNDSAVPPVPQTTPTFKSNTETVVDGAKDKDRKVQSTDVRTSDMKSPGIRVTVNDESQSARRMNIGDLKENRSDKSPSPCNQQPTVTIHSLFSSKFTSVT